MFKLDQETHIYTNAGVKILGVTETLNLSVKSFYGPEAETARQFGSALHKTIALLEQGKKIAFDMQLIPFIMAWEKFKATMPGIKFEVIEKSFLSLKYGYAGTPDLFAIYKKDRILIDLKTGTRTPLWELQIAAYYNLLAEAGMRPNKNICVQINTDKCIPVDYTRSVQLSFNVFLSFLNVAKWKFKNNLK